ncbi:MAG: AMP-binding protein [Gammaproteobacteria bacterium]
MVTPRAFKFIRPCLDRIQEMRHNDLENLLIGDVPRHIAARAPDSRAIIFGTDTYTYRDLDKLANRFANGLLALEPTPRARLVIMCGNSIEYPIIHFGVARTGCTLVHVPHRYGAKELGHVLKQTGAQFLIGDAGTFNLYHAVKNELRALPCLIGIGNTPDAGVISCGALIHEQPETPPDVSLKAADPACIMYTSGTTGNPKGAILSHRARMASSTAATEEYPLESSDIGIITIPLSHAAGLFSFFQPLMNAGACAVIMPKWDPGRFMDDVEQHSVTSAFVVPTQLTMLFDAPGFSAERLKSLKKCAYGGAPATPDLLRRAGAMLPHTEIIQAYGSTETGHLVFQHAGERRMNPGTLGKPGPRTELNVCRATGEPTGPGEAGEIVLNSPHLMDGYLDDPQATAEYFKSGDGRGWTGDLGSIDENGVLTLTGRTKEIIISGGINISPVELEEVITDHPAVSECAAFAIPDPKWGELPAAAIVLKPGQKATQEEIMAYAAGRLARFKRLRYVAIVDTLPHTASGKVQRALLKEQFAGALATRPAGMKN